MVIKFSYQDSAQCWQPLSPSQKALLELRRLTALLQAAENIRRRRELARQFAAFVKGLGATQVEVIGSGDLFEVLNEALQAEGLGLTWNWI
jgi:hypothetical protein